MDKIQKALFARITIKGTDAVGNELGSAPAANVRPISGNVYRRPGESVAVPHVYAPAYCSLNDGVITFRQSDDIKKTRYRLVVSGYPIEKLFVVRKGKDSAVKPVKRDMSDYEPCTDEDGNPIPEVVATEDYVVDVDFDDKIDAMKIRFIRDFADDLVVPVNFVDADKDRYYAEENRKIGEERLKAANISHSTGAALVNIRFQPCCDEYSYSTIAVYVSERGRTPGPRASVNGMPRPANSAPQSDWTEIQSYKLKGKDTFLAVKDLADGVYAYVLTQYDRKGNELLKTGFIRFEITSYRGGGRPVNWIN